MERIKPDQEEDRPLIEPNRDEEAAPPVQLPGDEESDEDETEEAAPGV